MTIAKEGSYRMFADFKHEGENQALARDLTVRGDVQRRLLPPPAPSATTVDGYEVLLHDEPARAGEAATLTFEVTRDGAPVTVEEYLGAKGHLLALHEGGLLPPVPPVQARRRRPDSGVHAGSRAMSGFLIGRLRRLGGAGGCGRCAAARRAHRR